MSLLGKILGELVKIQKIKRKIERKKPWRVLSLREMQVAKLMVQGHSSKVMAEKLFISPETVRTHRRNIYSKLEISSVQELAELISAAEKAF